MTSLRRHIPDLAIEWALDEPDRLWQAVDGTLCFADISGFTALSEKLSRRGRIGGEELVETLSRVFGGMLDSARERDGMLLKFGGDALLFLFKGQDHALRAASTAVEMRQALRKAREIPTSVGPLKLSMSVGLHSGQVYFFLVGSTHRELVLAGPDASMAAATESAANAGEIGISPGTAALLPVSAVKPRGDGLLLLKWRKPPRPPAGASPERQISESALRSLFPRALGEVLARGAPEPEHRVACIAFVRFSGTDVMLERDGPDAVAAALDATIGIAQRIFETEDITLLTVDIDKDGGKLFLGSGVPQATEDDEGRMLRALRRLADAKTPLPLQLGVNRGHVFAAEVGTRRRAAYSAMGDTTNTAARICAKAPPGELYAHPTVLAHSRTQYATEPAGPFTFKGKKVPQVVYRVGEETGDVASSKDAARLPTVGRKGELKVLGEAVDALATGVGGVISVVSAAGLGKTRLLEETLGRLEGLPRLELRADLYGANRPYRVFQEPLRALLGVQRGDAAAMRAQLEAGVARADESLLPYLALLGEAARIEVEPSAEVAAIEPRFRQDRVADCLIQLLESGLEGPRVIVMEDAQWSDGASTHLLGRLAAACATRPWLMLVTRRNEAGGFTPGDGPCLELGPMPPAEMAELVNQMTASAPLRPHELEMLVRRASGNPLYAQEMVRAAREAGSFEAVPDSLEAAIAAQVDALDPEARRVLRYATVLGRSFWRGTLDALLGQEGMSLGAALLERLESFLEPAEDDQLRFRVGLVRRTIYESLAFRLRARLHLEAGQVLERLAGDPSAKADSLATHFSIAGDAERTWHYARLAADRAARAYANADAARLYRLALDAARKLTSVDAAERVRVWTDCGNVCALADLFDEALHAYREAHRLVGDDPVGRAELLRLRALARERAGAFRQALRELSTGTRLLAGVATPEAARTRARLKAFTAMIRFAQEDYRQALAIGVAAAEEARRAGNKEALAQALVAAGLAQSFTGAGGAERISEALRIYEELGDLSSEAMVRNNLGVGAFIQGRWDEALASYEGAAAAKLKAGNPVGAASAASNCGELYAKQGRLDEAETILRDSIRVMRASGFHDGAAYAEIQFGRVLVARGRAQEGEELLERVGAELTGFGRKSSALEAALVQSLALLQLDRAADALDLVERAAAAAGGATGYLAPQAEESRALALTALGRYEEAEASIAQGLALAREQGLRHEEGMLLNARTALRMAQGHEPDPSDVREAAQIMKVLGVRPTPSTP
jgi:class 3 adenylate cyclase/tetratricopeptide (TPR) repeat protein